MSTRQVPEKFLVAFSFAGEQRELVHDIAKGVEEKLGHGKIFFDEWFMHYIAGDDADLKLQKIYEKKCELVIVCVSAHYGEKPWTQAEHRAIRARQMQIQKSQKECDQHRILPIRVGDGDVPGIHFNAIAPDVRAMSIPKIVELIVERLDLIIPEIVEGQSNVNADKAFPERPVSFAHNLADREIREWPAVLNLLTHNASKRILMFKGPSGYSKSALLGAAAKYAKNTLHVPTAYVDFNVTEMRKEASFLRELRLGLAQTLPFSSPQQEPNQWTFRQALRDLKDPALILLDTYEDIANSELAEFIEKQLLAESESCATVRFIIGGQKIPDASQSLWHTQAEIVELAPIFDVHVWKRWIHSIYPNMDEKHVEGVVFGLEGVPAAVSVALKACARNLSRIA